MPAPRRFFLDWHQPLIAAAVDHLCGDWRGGMLDLADRLCIVPTAQAGRRLREALAARARGAAVLSPLVVTPEVLLDWAEEAQPAAASPGEALLAWATVLQQLPLDDFRDLFPVDPVSQDFAWALGVAGDLRRLRRTPGEAGHGLAEAAALLGPEHPEAARWEALARVEQHCEAALTEKQRPDPQRVRIAALSTPRVPDEIRRICLIAVTDPIGAVVRVLEQLSERLPVDVLIHAPVEPAGRFDTWGRPRAEAWCSEIILIPEPEQRILIHTRPEGSAEYITEELRQHAATRGSIAVGVADPEVTRPLETLAAGAGIRLFNPEGTPLSSHETLWLLRCLAELLRGDSFASAELLLRIPEVADAVIDAVWKEPEAPPPALELSGGTPPPAQRRPGMGLLAGQLDEFRSERLPVTLGAALPLARDWEEAAAARALKKDKVPSAKYVSAALEWLSDAMRGLSRAEDFAVALTDLLGRIYAARRHGSAAEARMFDTAAGHIRAALDSVQQGCALFAPQLHAAGKLDLLLHLLRDVQLFPEPGSGEIDVQGWLELPWEDAPRLCIAGMNDGRVPEAVAGDRWLPDSARTVLGLRTNASRLARDVFHLTAIIESRRASGGTVTLLAARESSSGEPLRPSRLLLACPDAELAARAMQLFSHDAAKSPRASLAWQRAWALRPPAPDPDKPREQISVTSFSDWLTCPFRYYLKHELGMQPWSPMADEMDARAFGTLIHNCMEALHADPELRDSDNADAIIPLLHREAERHLHRLHGAVLGVPLMIQLEAAKNRLIAAARLHAQSRAEGWRFHYCEVDFPSLPGSTEKFLIEGMEVRGRIDLIEKHEDGRIRILDYKTYGKPKTPAEKHTGRVPRDPPRPLHDWEMFADGESRMRWLDLQLALYAYVARKVWGDRVSVGFVLLPRAMTEAKIEMWDSLDRATLESAHECARGIAREIQSGNFWPPSDKVRFEDYEDLFFRNVTESVEPEWFVRKPAAKKKRGKHTAGA